ncbi:GHKL domain-containing protein [Mycolicibacterium hippocampi]|uniref:GHKL domain-containing protein n=1 Tax=Mycolicibacterium hippocampi TaxID=659824 RepID=UPI0013D4F4CA|nr:GHKL domain-containing protein [Mycolicibacterium hippocampi]
MAWLLQHPQQISTRDLIQAIQAETVPRLRKTLIEVLEIRQKASVSGAGDREEVDTGVDGTSQRSSLPDHADVAALIRHELSGPVGWIRLAAADEIPSFATSMTNDAIRKLQRRIDGLVTMIKASEPLKIQRLSLPHVLIENWPYTRDSVLISPANDASSDDIDTDEGLFALMLSNIFQNAMDAALEVEDEPKIHIAWGCTERDFWVRVTNPFKGDRLSLDDVVPVGSSSKKAHQGRGLALIRTVGDRLGLRVSLEGVSGTASFTFSGERWN